MLHCAHEYLQIKKAGHHTYQSDCLINDASKQENLNVLVLLSWCVTTHVYLADAFIFWQLLRRNNKRVMAKWSKGLTLPMSDIRFGQKRADLVCEWDAVGHLVDVV